MKVQCLLPKYNNGKYFWAAIESLATQTVPFDSILVSENHSTDGSAHLVAEAAKKWKNIRYFTPPVFAPTGGHNGAELIDRMDPNVDFVHCASADDVWHPDFLRRLIRFIERGPGRMTAAYTDRVLIDEHDRCFGASGNIRTKTYMSVANLEGFRHHARGCCFIVAGALFSGDIVRNFSELCRQTTWCADWIQMMECARQGTVGYLAEPLFRYRFHSANSTKLHLSFDEQIKTYAGYLGGRDAQAQQIFIAMHEATAGRSHEVRAKPSRLKKNASDWLKLIGHRTGAIKTLRYFQFG